MSIVRLSCVRDTLCAPKADGDFVDTTYNRRRRLGRMESLASPGLPDDGSDLEHYLNTALAPATGRLEDGAPVVVMVHGFLFDPRHTPGEDRSASHNPHTRVYHFDEAPFPDERREHHTGWPGRLGFRENDGGRRGVAIAFGWHSNPGFAGALIRGYPSHYARAYAYAGETSWPLAAVIDQLAGHHALARRPIDIVAHSLGARVVVRAIAQIARHAPALLSRLGRVLLLGGAEYVVEGQLMYDRVSRAGLPPSMGPTFYNIVSRENDVLDVLAENCGPRTFGYSQVIGRNGLEHGGRAERWMDLQIDSGDLQAWLAERGHAISGDDPANVWDHWYYYTFPGNMRFYEAILRDRAAFDFAALRRPGEAIPEGVPRCWDTFMRQFRGPS